MSKTGRIFLLIVISIILAAIIAVPLIWPTVWAWMGVLFFFTVLLMVMGAGTTGSPFGALINEHNLMSLSRFQAVVWTLVILSSYFVIVAARIKGGAPNPLVVDIDPQLLMLMGIAATSLVGAPLVNTSKLSQTPAQTVPQATIDALAANQNLPDSTQGPALLAAITQAGKGILYSNPKVSDASIWDMFEGDELGNTASMDFGKVQMFYFTLIVVISYIYCLWPLLRNASAVSSLPVIPPGMVALLGISNAGYLGNKAVTHTPTQ